MPGASESLLPAGAFSSSGPAVELTSTTFALRLVGESLPEAPAQRNPGGLTRHRVGRSSLKCRLDLSHGLPVAGDLPEVAADLQCLSNPTSADHQGRTRIPIPRAEVGL